MMRRWPCEGRPGLVLIAVIAKNQIELFLGCKVDLVVEVQLKDIILTIDEVL